MRASGVLLPVASLPSEYGIGAFSKEAYKFVDMLKKAGQRYWQILPLGPTGYGDSPYQSFSTFAGNPYFIDLNTLVNKRWISKKDCKECDFGSDSRYVDYGTIYQNRWGILKKAFEKSEIENNTEFQAFCKENEEWLNDYALYTVIKEENGGKSWSEWETAYRLRDEGTLQRFAEEHQEGIRFQKFLQFEFYEEWNALKSYANQNGIEIIGDIPIYVAFDSADAWSHPELFQFDENRMPVGVAGCPPDAFSATGQLWGNPLYDWNYHKETGYEWWAKRIDHCRKLYDIIRIDHFRGFDEYYWIPAQDETAEFGHWEKGPGMDIFHAVEQKLGKIRIIAEDLGFLTDSVLKMVADSGFPGMKVLEFAFDSREPSDYLPHNYTKNCVVYTGTHDNETLAGWYRKLDAKDKRFALKYLGAKKLDNKEAVWAIIRMALASVADTCIIPIQDYLCLGNEARINQPSTLGGNWMWRLKKEDIDNRLLKEIREMSELYGRVPKEF
ncbi:MAG: 4-alpha-glucanotransferase [Bariatricus sp.]|nr:4-alpha-glucanotransferase [Bariatricus sp.]